MNESQEATAEMSQETALHLARLDRLVRTAARVRSLAERIATDCEAAPAETLQADVGELKSLADDLVLLGYTFREAPLAPMFHRLQEWVLRQYAAVQIECSGERLQVDHRLLPALRERLQELVALLLELTAAQQGDGGAAHLRLQAGLRGRSLVMTMICDELELGAADLVRVARNGGLAPETPEALLRFPGRLIFSPAFAIGWGLPASWQERLLRLRDRLRNERGDLQLRERSGGQWAFSLQLPLDADLAAVLVVRSGAELFGLPIEAVFSTRRVAPEEWQVAPGRLWLEQAAPAPVEGFAFADWLDAGPVEAAELSRLLEDGEPGAVNMPEDAVSCVILEDGDGMAAVMVDEVLGERQVLLRRPRQLLRRVPLFLGSFLLPSEEICVVLNPWDLLQKARR